MIHQFDNLEGHKHTNKFFFWGKVVSIEDDFESRRIKVFVPEIDSWLGDQEKFSLGDKNIRKKEGNITDTLVKNLPTCYPILPPFFHYVPQIGERVMVFMDRYHDTIKEGQQEKRYYLSVSISQPQKIDFDGYDDTADAAESDGKSLLENPIKRITKAKGTFAQKNEIGVIGRRNTDILMKNGEVLMRAGRHLKNDTTQFNEKDPAYVQLRHGVNNAGNEIKKKVITEEIINPQDHVINAVISNKFSLEITVNQFRDNLEIENIKEAYSTLQFALNALNDYLTDLKDKYPKYQIIVVNNAENTTSETFYTGYKTFINKEVEIREQNNLDQFGGSVVNIVADKINLISHKNDKNFSLTDRSENITTASQIEINTKASPMVNGDIVYKLLELMRFVIINHVHPYSGLPTDPDKLVQDLRDFDLDSILNKNIRLS
jgi:hypothetical protein